jgi:hypothetical protein
MQYSTTMPCVQVCTLSWWRLAVLAIVVAGGARFVATLYPSKALAEHLTARWREATGTRLHIVAEAATSCGFITLASKDKPLIFLGADRHLSPWITPKMVHRYGLMAVWNVTGSDAVPAFAQRLGVTQPSGRVSANWPLGVGRSVDIVYAIVPPAPE